MHVFQTINRTSCVYVHRDLQGSVFYVGSGSDQRPYDRSSRSEEWHEKAREGYTVEVLLQNVPDRKYAFKLEDRLIETYGLLNLTNKTTNKQHQLTVATIAGKKSKGRIFSDQARANMSNGRKGISPTNKGKKLNKITGKYQ